MSSIQVPNEIVLFWYPSSPYGRRMTWYLALRSIPYAECIQPHILPRPTLDALGLKYRRSPVMAIGRDLYVDTRLMIAKLEQMFPPSAEHPALSTPETAGVASLLQKLTIEGSVFREVVKQMPSAVWKDPKFAKDRAGFMPESGMKTDGKTTRAEGITHMREMFAIIESMFADGREWIAGTGKLSLADLEGLWAIDWFIKDLRASTDYFTAGKYPKLFAWRDRFRAVLKQAREQAPKAVSLKGEDAVKFVTSASFTDQATTIDESDPLNLKQGATVELYPTDGGGYTHQDHGKLVKLTKDEVAIAIQAKSGEEIRVHAPRWQFRVRAVDAAKL
ncbi:unnamed protein product [Zymoseptoria tritici ST99CH_1A5]|uniref:Uncharacterized protein n=1 Tax=Zymoseptoria tritici ST99CH_1A5 TaxID=1276529 RepID=A0A1Y6LDD6_ZYMTR|nr:unnamed protein product [Zymoseptoria tritici ST99CH_1A5]